MVPCKVPSAFCSFLWLVAVCAAAFFSLHCMLTVFIILAARRYVLAHPAGVARMVLLLILCLIGQPVRSFAQGNLLLSPRRVVFEDQRRSAELNLANSGSDTARYAISMMEVRMKEDGGFEVIEDTDSAGAFIASPYVRFFPRSVTLGPNEAQTVKIQVVRSGELVPGEYRSHLYFRAVPQASTEGEKPKPTDTTSVSVSLRPTFGISIPVIIRVGEPNGRASISDVAFDGGEEPSLRMVFNRSGNTSVYGDVQVEHVADNGTVTTVGTAKGVAVYTCIDKRKFSLALNKSAGVDYTRGELKLSYLNQSPKAEPLAVSLVKLGN